MRISDWSSDVCSSDLALALFSIVALTACNGPNQEAGREQDKASATARGEPYSGSGPNERLVEVRDRAAAAEQNVRDAAADALKEQGRNLERQAKINATRPDEKAQIGRASVRERVGGYVSSPAVAVHIKKKGEKYEVK